MNDTMTEDNNGGDTYDFPSTWEIYKDEWENNRRWRWEMILYALALIALLVFALSGIL